MRRPLFAFCLCFVACIAVWINLADWKDNSNSPPNKGEEIFSSGSILIATGQVYQKESKISFNSEILILYIKSVSIQSINQNTNQNMNQSITQNVKMLSDESDEVSKDIISYEKNLICELSGDTDIAIGSYVQIRGQAELFSKASNPGEFDSAQYYEILNIGGKIKNAQILAVKEKQWSLLELLHKMESSFKERIYTCFPEKEASIISTMLLGDKSGLDSEIKSLYKRNGIIHILSISGLHITIIGMGIYHILRKIGLSQITSALIGCIILLLFGIMTGMAVSACRAIGMYMIRMFGECIGRSGDMLTSVGIMGVFVLIKQPLYLYHSGFYLSFGSILGIGMLCPALSSLFHRKKIKSKETFSYNMRRKVVITYLESGKEKLKNSLLSGLSVMLFTLPIHFWFYYEIPIYSLFLNVLILPFMNIIVTVSLFVMIVKGAGFLSPIVNRILWGYESLCTLFDTLPHGTWIRGKPLLWQILIYYGMLALLIMYIWRKNGIEREGGIKKDAGIKDIDKADRKHNIIVVVWILGAVLFLGARFKNDTVITFLDVGQGDAICIQTKEGQTFLVDGGSSSKSNIGKYILIPFLKYQGIEHIDGIFVTHPDADHMNGILELLKNQEENNITVGTLILPAIALEKRQEELGELMQSVQMNTGETGVKFMSVGEEFYRGDFSLTCLHPPKEYAANDTNSYSLCFLLEYKELSILLTGDVEGDGERLLLEELEKRKITEISILKVAHHGSKNSTGESILNQLQPRISIISCGQKNRYGHPHEELLLRLTQVDSYIMQTGKSGAIQIKIKKGKIAVQEYLF
ncbi:DNA internalization-related competence protein ComEC/Rec2 [Lachnospiraceae bacterium OttesenSCG-928-D06]|nr:DNA internalization-related competence protein ComEC/Rec2 [Lachnospiraceae bacterium OttesenSCG-928-D06]